MKPGQIVAKKTRSAGKRLVTGLVFLTWGLAQLACSGQFVTPPQLTATAAAAETAVAEANSVIASVATQNPVVAAENLETATPTHAAIGSGGEAGAQPEIPTPEPPATAIPTGTSEPAAPLPPTPTPDQTRDAPILYYTQAGDTLKALALRFNVLPEEITSPEPIPTEGLFDPGILLLIPPRLSETSSSTPLIPDSEVVYSPSALDLELEKFIAEAGGYLTGYQEWRTSGWHDGAKVIRRVAIENSVNPRLLLAILEYQSHWVYGQPQNLAETDYPIGWLRAENEKKGLYYQLSWAVQQLNIGYYGWRDGTLTEVTFPDGSTLRLAPDLNAGTVALLYLFSRLYNQPQWAGILYGPEGFMALYEKMFGNPWLRAQTVEPLFPATLTQPPLELPFLPGHTWAFTGGPHNAWGSATLGARAALDFAPSAVKPGCEKTDEWATASASGLVVRSENGVVVQDLDGDGYEQTGWVILYLHIHTNGRVPVGTWVNVNDPIGHPSCEGGPATGTHVHMARKYNGEWILADGPMPFVLSGWRAHADPIIYLGTLTKDGQTVYSSTVGSFESRVTRPKTTP